MIALTLDGNTRPAVRPRLLIAQPSLQPPGGGNAVAVWLVEALKHDYDITIYAWQPLDFEAINRYVGSSLRSGDIKVRLVPRALYWAHRAMHVRASLWQRYFLQRFVRNVAGDFDLVISVNNEIDVGRRALQYIHFPWGWWPRPDADLRWFHRIPGVLRLYYALGARVAPVSAARIARNRTLVNSDWTGAKFRELYGSDGTTVYPPAAVEAAGRKWDEREDTFVVLGLIAAHKNIETAIAIVDRLRASGHPVRLRIVGGRGDRKHLGALRRAVQSRAEWLTLHLDVSRPELLELLSRSRYGLHSMTDEHFGMAPAEMAASGCVVFVHDSGGQVEIVGHDARLVWRSVDDAVAKIGRVLSDAALQRELQRSLLARSAAFSVQRFSDQVRVIVAEEVAGSETRPPRSTITRSQ